MARFLVVALATALVGLLSILPPGSVQGEVIANVTLDENCTSPTVYTLNPGEAVKFNTDGSNIVNCTLEFDGPNCGNITLKCNKFDPEENEFMTVFHGDNKTRFDRNDRIKVNTTYPFNLTELKIRYVNKVDEPRDNTTMKCVVRCKS
ncbi:uncharacterized protein LOC143038748 [Oratosquilla oratoria]|uniref:uncharacterized protein LOC143038748 n=1 Tax=Oratosquilla oratoria TaxID=337810 RepID=UPI003F76EB49